jgi:hypothetical protein
MYSQISSTYLILMSIYVGRVKYEDRNLTPPLVSAEDTYTSITVPYRTIM